MGQNRLTDLAVIHIKIVLNKFAEKKTDLCV